MTDRIIGQRLPVVDAVVKVTGRARYAQDMKLPGTLFARTLRSPLPHANIVKIDIAKAQAIPGVAAVLTADDMPPSSFQRPLDTGPLLNKDKVRMVGDAVAVVAAVDVATAIKAIDAIEVQYEPLPSVFDPERAMQAGAPKLFADAPNGNVGYDTGLQGKNILVERGDITQGLAQSDRVFQGRYTVSQQQNSSPGPRSTLAAWDGDQLTVWIPSQGVHGHRQDLARVLGIPESKIRVISSYSTGGYGSGNHAKGTNFSGAAAAMLAWRTGKPVKMEFSRWEEIILGMGRHPAVVELKIGVKNDGTINALDARVIQNTGAHGDYASPLNSTVSYISSLYRAPHVRVEGIYVSSNIPQAREMRSFGAPQGHFPLESLVDEVAQGLSMDPVDFRLKNHLAEGDVWGAGPAVVGTIGFEDAINKAADAFGWKEARAKYPIKNGTKVRGIGMAITNQSPVQNPSSALVEVRPDGTSLVRAGSGNMGQSAVTALGQIVAEIVGVPWDNVRLVYGDSDSTAYDAYSLGSRAALNTGNAFRVAAEEARSKLFQRAADLLKVKPDEIDMQDLKFVLKTDTSQSVTFAQAASGSVTASGYSSLGTSPVKGISNAAYFAEVEVDTATGKVSLLRLVAAQDWGKAINPLIVETQMEGALIQGIGYAMSEDVILDPATGIPTNASWLEYKLPMAQDIPDITAIIVESNDAAVMPMGIKGGGETCLAGPAPAIANAVFNAVGVRIKDLPITANKVLAGLRQKA
jgi:CO/xanthine dehydrogenase Mo-binding subunit